MSDELAHAREDEVCGDDAPIGVSVPDAVRTHGRSLREDARTDVSAGDNRPGESNLRGVPRGPTAASGPIPVLPVRQGRTPRLQRAGSLCLSDQSGHRNKREPVLQALTAPPRPQPRYSPGAPPAQPIHGGSA